MTGSADRITQIAVDGFKDYCVEFAAITGRAGERFEAGDWPGLQDDAAERLELYSVVVDHAVAGIESALGDGVTDHGVWATARTVYDEAVARRPDAEIAKSFFSSITRRVLRTG